MDLGDGVLCLEFHSKMNSLGEDFVRMAGCAMEETSRGFEAMVIANDGENFSVGANLMQVLLAAQEGDWHELNRAIHRFQQVNMALKYAAMQLWRNRKVCAIFCQNGDAGLATTLRCRDSTQPSSQLSSPARRGRGPIRGPPPESMARSRRVDR